jgi:hypothetical protein
MPAFKCFVVCLLAVSVVCRPQQLSTHEVDNACATVLCCAVCCAMPCVQADAARLVQQGLSRERRTELITNRCGTTAAAAAAAASRSMMVEGTRIRQLLVLPAMHSVHSEQTALALAMLLVSGKGLLDLQLIA